MAVRRGLERWAYFVLGGALLTPYVLVALLAVPLAEPERFAREHTAAQAVVLVSGSLVLIAATSLLPLVRQFECVTASALLGGHAGGLVPHPARTAGARVRAAGWFAAHLVGGGVLSVATLLTLPVAVLLLAGTLTPGSVDLHVGGVIVERAWATPIAVATLAALLAVIVLAGRTAAWLAPVLLGPDPIARMEELERRTDRLAERNRLAQELHDSIGHALAVVSLQAAAARRVLDSDPAFVARALDEMVRTGRVAAADLDGVLGLLRDEPGATVPTASLRDLPSLVAAHRGGGLAVHLDLVGDPDTLPGPVSRELYRIAQESLTNAAKHAAEPRASMIVELRDDEARLAVTNSLPTRSAGRRHGRDRPGAGGRGLDGVRERVELLGGELVVGHADHEWRLEVRIPLAAARPRTP